MMVTRNQVDANEDVDLKLPQDLKKLRVHLIERIWILTIAHGTKKIRKITSDGFLEFFLKKKASDSYLGCRPNHRDHLHRRQED